MLQTGPWRPLVEPRRATKTIGDISRNSTRLGRSHWSQPARDSSVALIMARHVPLTKSRRTSWMHGTRVTAYVPSKFSKRLQMAGGSSEAMHTWVLRVQEGRRRRGDRRRTATLSSNKKHLQHRVYSFVFSTTKLNLERRSTYLSLVRFAAMGLLHHAPTAPPSPLPAPPRRLDAC